jgi:AcrR family transcriptional regulator
MTVAEPPRWRRLEPDARREQILDCAVRLFGERPYAAVSATEIARAAGVARGLLNHYFGTKRDLYLEVVRRLVIVPGLERAAEGITGSLRTRVERSVDWYLDTVSLHGRTFVAVTGAEGFGADPEIERILAEADNLAAGAVLTAVGIPRDEQGAEQLAAVRTYGALAKAAVREWIRDGNLTREQLQLLLSQALITVVRDVLPGLRSVH